MSDPAKKLSKKDFESNQEVRWCPGCGDYSILATVQRVLPELDIPRENHVFISGIGCSGRFPYYMNTYGFHTIHGRAPAVATGVKLSNPDLTVWVITGDGDALSIGGNHFIHLLRRNVNVNVLLFNNRIYGLTKGQYSPTSEQGKKTKSSPDGSLESPIDPAAIAFAAGASFIARAPAVDAKLLSSVLKQAVEHQGTSLIEIFQNCNVFNDGAFDNFVDRSVRNEKQIVVEDGKPLCFGKDQEKSLEITAKGVEIISSDQETATVYNAKDKSLAQRISALPFPEYPVAMGVLYAEERPTYDQLINESISQAASQKSPQQLGDLLKGGNVWKIV